MSAYKAQLKVYFSSCFIGSQAEAEKTDGIVQTTCSENGYALTPELPSADLIILPCGRNENGGCLREVECAANGRPPVLLIQRTDTLNPRDGQTREKHLLKYSRQDELKNGLSEILRHIRSELEQLQAMKTSNRWDDLFERQSSPRIGALMAVAKLADLLNASAAWPENLQDKELVVVDASLASATSPTASTTKPAPLLEMPRINQRRLAARNVANQNELNEPRPSNGSAKRIDASGITHDWVRENMPGRFTRSTVTVSRIAECLCYGIELNKIRSYQDARGFLTFLEGRLSQTAPIDQKSLARLLAEFTRSIGSNGSDV